MHSEADLRSVLLQDAVPLVVAPSELPRPWEIEACAEGYAGTLCAQCQPGYTRWGSFECRKCYNDVSMGFLLLFGVVLILGITAKFVVDALQAAASADDPS